MKAKLIEFMGNLPVRQNKTDVGYDLSCAGEFRIGPGKRMIVMTGLRLALPEGVAGLVCSRSGLALRDGVIVLNAPGVIDPGYRGEVGVILLNTGDHPVQFLKGSRIAQLLLVSECPVEWQECFDLPDSDRGEGGFGSTGEGAT